jgi:hypothetical protein
LLPVAASASAPGLQINPLQYEDTLTDHIKNGHVDVSNPTDTKATINTSVRGFRQQGDRGDLEFYDDADLSAAIKVDLQSFELGPREAVRVLFSVDPAKLPKGGVYATIFFSTQPADQPSASSFVSQSANVGILLLLHNGGDVAPSGRINNLALPFWQFGNGLSGSATLTNTASPHGGVAFRPGLEAKVFPWGHATKQPTGLILPGSTRQFGVRRPGSFLGLLPVTLTDTQTHSHRTAWVFACTGFYSWGLLVIFLAMLVLGLLWFVRLKRPRRQPLAAPTAEPALPAFDPQPDPEPDPEAEKPAPEPIISIPVVSAAEPEPDPEPEPDTEPEKPAPTKIAVVVDSPKPAPKRRSHPHRPDPKLRRATDISPRRPPRP